MKAFTVKLKFKIKTKNEGVQREVEIFKIKIKNVGVHCKVEIFKIYKNKK